MFSMAGKQKIKLLTLKAVRYKEKAREAASADILEGQRELAQTVPRMEHGPFNAQNEAGNQHIC